MTNEQQIQRANKIRDNYTAKVPTKYDELNSLNEKVQTPPRAIAYVLGVLGTLVMGFGMCITLGAILKTLFPLGIALGCVGIAIMIATPFIHKAILKARKKKYGEQIIALVDEISGN
ncbi:MAG: hypothetical protein K2N18_05235 [Clostridia bacterium]|nr:hypothetical protein [Clostridia bacterium]